MKVIGLCGGSGSGKGIVSSLFAKCGIPAIDTDKVYREITSADGPCNQALALVFGSEIISDDGSLNRKALAKIVKGKHIAINVIEVKKPDANAQLLAESIAAQLEKRASFRRTMKQAIQRAQKAGVKGIKVMVSGRLDGAEIARSEQYHEGSIPLQTLRADIEYGLAEALTTFGILGIKVWIYKGEVLGGVVKTEGED